MKLINLFFLLLFLTGCSESEQERKNRLITEWSGREIVFPTQILRVAGEDTLDYRIPYSEFLVVSYCDSMDCLSFRQRLSQWKDMIAKVEALPNVNVSFIFFLKPIDVDEMRYILRKENFTYPVYFDREDRFRKLNRFPQNTEFRSFLLDMQRHVLAIGNPLHDPEVYKTYMSIIERGRQVEEPKKIITTFKGDLQMNLGNFDWRKPYYTKATLRNTGDEPLTITHVMSSSTNIFVEFSSDPVAPGKKWELSIRYTADEPRFFDNNIMIFCNVKESPLYLNLKGNAK